MEGSRVVALKNHLILEKREKEVMRMTRFPEETKVATSIYLPRVVLEKLKEGALEMGTSLSDYINYLLLIALTEV